MSDKYKFGDKIRPVGENNGEHSDSYIVLKQYGYGVKCVDKDERELKFLPHEIELVRPQLPTCSTCKYLHDTPDEWPRCNAWRKNQAISDMTDNDISDPEEMGCIYHSDYGDAK